VADTFNNQVKRLAAISLGATFENNFGGVFLYPEDLAANADSVVLVADTQAGQIHRIEADGRRSAT
jgi:hypothetical protein